jgi:hypothetical protein
MRIETIRVDTIYGDPNVTDGYWGIMMIYYEGTPEEQTAGALFSYSQAALSIASSINQTCTGGPLPESSIIIRWDVPNPIPSQVFLDLDYGGGLVGGTYTLETTWEEVAVPETYNEIGDGGISAGGSAVAGMSQEEVATGGVSIGGICLPVVREVASPRICLGAEKLYCKSSFGCQKSVALSSGIVPSLTVCANPKLQGRQQFNRVSYAVLRRSKIPVTAFTK